MSIIETMQQLVSQTGSWTLPKGKSSTVVLDRVGMRLSQQAALLEMDVTRARRQIRLANRGGQSSVSFVAWIIRSIAASLAGHPDIRQVKRGTHSNDAAPITICLLVDRMVGPHRVASPLLIHSANDRSVGDIEAAIHRARALRMDATTFVAGRPTGLHAAIYRALPGFLQRRSLERAVRRRRRLDAVDADVMVSMSGMGGRVKGWFIPTSRHPVCIGVGAVTPEAVMVNGTIEKREVFHMTLLLDNDATDGKAASGWISDLVRSVERAREFETA